MICGSIRQSSLFSRMHGAAGAWTFALAQFWALQSHRKNVFPQPGNTVIKPPGCIEIARQLLKCICEKWQTAVEFGSCSYCAVKYEEDSRLLLPKRVLENWLLSFHMNSLVFHCIFLLYYLDFAHLSLKNSPYFARTLIQTDGTFTSKILGLCFRVQPSSSKRNVFWIRVKAQLKTNTGMFHY